MRGDRQLLKAVRRLFSRSRVSAEQLQERGQEEEVEEAEEYEEEEEEEELGAVVNFRITGLANIRLPRKAIMTGEPQKKVCRLFRSFTSFMFLFKIHFGSIFHFMCYALFTFF